MSAFFLFDNVEVTDPDKLAQYARDVAPVVKRYGGRYRVLGGEITVHEGTWSPTYPVMIEFNDAAAALDWYNSDAYRPLKALRQEAVQCNAVLIDGA